jgi:two-component system chemotaxis response regulator CheY
MIVHHCINCGEIGVSSQQSALVVDDNFDNRMIFTIALKQAGYKVVEAGDGFTCMEILKQGLPFHLMVLDLRMPLMSGIEVLKAMRDLPKCDSMHVIVCTGNPEMVRGEDVKQRADYVVSKPIDPAQFVQLAQRLQQVSREPQ